MNDHNYFRRQVDSIKQNFIKRLIQRKINISLIFENLIGERCSAARNRRSDVISQYTEVQYRNIQTQENSSDHKISEKL